MVTHVVPPLPAGMNANPMSHTPARRLLFLLPFAPRLDAVHGGARAMAQLLTRLARRHSVAVLYLRAQDELPADEILQRQCELVEESIRPDNVGTEKEKKESVIRVWGSLLRGRPVWVSDWWVAAFAARVSHIAQSWKPDIVQMEFHVMAQYISALANCPAPRVLTEHEPGAQAAHERRHSGQSEGRLLPHLDFMAWKRFERESLREVDAVVVFTDRDRQVLAPFLGKTPAVIIPLGTEIPKHPLNPQGCLPVNLLFIGSFKHWPNVEAATYLIKTIFPRMQDQFPDLKLYIVGDQPPLHLSERNNEHVIVTGRVADITPYLDRASVIAVPLHHGGGMRVKVLEALAAGKAMVATRLAVEGLDVLDGKHVILADDDLDFSNALARLLTHPKERIELAGRAHLWASTHLGWDKSVDAYEALYERLLQ